MVHHRFYHHLNTTYFRKPTIISEKELNVMFFTFTSGIATAVEYFIAGSSAAISLYCGVKLPKNRR